MQKESANRYFDFSGRSSGILLHLTSLPGQHGSGDLGPDAHHFLEIMEKAGQSWWQMLPVGPPGIAPSVSPYDSTSVFAGSPWLVSLELLANEGLLTRAQIKPASGLSGSRLNFSEMMLYRNERLLRAFKTFRSRQGEKRAVFRDFQDRNANWLEDFTLFMALRHKYEGKPWTEWKEDLRKRQSEAMLAARQQLKEEIAFHRFIQFKFDQQWKALREDSHRRGIGLIGDIPIFVAHDSADVWSHQELFQLTGQGRPRKVSGYPPDRFSSLGQLWGHPLYEWSVHLKSDFKWWVDRFARLYELFDALRIDHFLGFTRTWSIPADFPDARKGRWVKSPGSVLFSEVERVLGKRPMIAEDLGHVTPADIKLRNRFGMLQMRIFQFGFGNEEDSACHLPHNYSLLCAAYTGNHDNDTLRGWYIKLSAARKRMVQVYTGGQSATIHLDSIRSLQCSAANLVIFPLQDILGMGARARMNIPGTRRGNWTWRLDSEIPSGIIKVLRQQTMMFGRIPSHNSLLKNT
jgi:4-alpha-glucanotransferase